MVSESVGGPLRELWEPVWDEPGVESDCGSRFAFQIAVNWWTLLDGPVTLNATCVESRWGCSTIAHCSPISWANAII